MLWSALRHLLWVILLFFILTLISFAILMRDPLNEALIQNNILGSYFYYLNALLQGDLGITYNGGQSLKSLIFTVLPPTLELCFTALLLAFIFSIPLGILSAVNNQGIFSKTLQSLSYVGLSIPIFWLAPILLYMAAIYGWEISATGQYNLLYEIPPITGFPVVDVWFVDVPYRTKIVQSVLQHLALPTLILCILPTMEIIRTIQQRAEYILQQNYTKTAVTRGWSKWKILQQYVFRNTFPLLVPQITRVFTLVLTQCMLVETVLGWPGIGRWLIDAVSIQDYNSISAGVIVLGICIITIDTLAKTVMFILDPFNKKGWYAR
ncbi:ABC transporter permease [Rodentibacter trehalosifermentans]|uniref:Peptide ABC transporter permease n=1 Tax=Rodentibacter trehalosifermentans TaxID=1908263 RepID=A0A1V3IYR2_9PAST|nr:ABC transporter permease subunit [Rodentibacter trehalosifermentans]OOF47340.1 peptide ABC transporter permease [Rodentibacter trehalosifermentans]OOF49057.1 peptide ABC transporter permease [Rodentibacter trehalosifermentans]OOF52868.1 peptide ABC transporter permease [Rodentibacter trehalosifermentans]